jgi:hypothetical protein
MRVDQCLTSKVEQQSHTLVGPLLGIGNRNVHTQPMRCPDRSQCICHSQTQSIHHIDLYHKLIIIVVVVVVVV